METINYYEMNIGLSFTPFKFETVDGIYKFLDKQATVLQEKHENGLITSKELGYWLKTYNEATFTKHTKTTEDFILKLR